MPQSNTTYDVLVIGSGISGLSAAIASAEKGLSVCVVTKSSDESETNTLYAQGGIVGKAPNDSPDLLYKDILSAGDHLNFIPAVELIAREGPSLVQEYLIEKAGVPFMKKGKNDFDWTVEGAHSTRRILHVKDNTGEAIMNGLLNYIKSFKGITLYTAHAAVEIITNSHNSTDPQERYKKTRAIGAYILDEKSGEIKRFYASAVVLSTGGAGNLYLYTSNPHGATGDGIAMAYRSGCEIINTEFVQFHPTILFHRDKKRFLISEALRGEGARLMNHSGDYFMERYNPELKDLAPRDEVARAIYRELDEEGSDYIFLDARCIKKVSPKERFPGIYDQCKLLGIDIEKEPIPVVPAAHYFCGGIKVDLFGQTGVSGLYAVGESSCTGVHGANRLASVSLLEALVFGIRTGRHISQNRVDLPSQLLANIPEWIYPKNEEDFDTMLIHHDLQNIRNTMWNYVGIIRTKKRLERALSDLNYLNHRIERFYIEAKVSRRIIELRNAVLSGTLVARAAVSNSRSIGCHFVE
jgi:L-aspartate oxidase